MFRRTDGRTGLPLGAHAHSRCARNERAVIVHACCMYVHIHITHARTYYTRAETNDLDWSLEWLEALSLSPGIAPKSRHSTRARGPERERQNMEKYSINGQIGEGAQVLVMKARATFRNFILCNIY